MPDEKTQTTVTLAEVRRVVDRAHGWCSYYSRTNETIGPYQVRNLSGPTTSCHYDQRRGWDTQIAVALAEEAFSVDLSQQDIVNVGPWRDTVRSIYAAIKAELDAEAEYDRESAAAAC